MPDYVQLELPLGQEATPWRPSEDEKLRQLRIADGRAKLLELLYEADGRTDPGHPQHGFYTGLGERHHQIVGQALVECLLGQEGFDPAALVPVAPDE